MNGFLHPTKDERVRHIKASLARVYYPEPLELPEWMKEQIQTLNAEGEEHEEKPH